jgi:16S rRNA processing protein RimM
LSAPGGGDRAGVQGDGKVQAGRVGRPHGLDGSFYVTRALARLLSADATVSVGGTDFQISRRAGTDQRPIIRLAGIDGRAGAEALRGADIRVEPGELPALKEGEWWAHELEGCRVTAGELVLGEVRRLLELPSCEALEVDRGPAQEPLIVPLVKDAVREVDVVEGRIEVDPEFLDLDAGAGG